MGEAIGIRDLKNNLSAVLRRVKNGETVTIKERNQPIAVLVPTSEGEGDEHILARLAGVGRLSWSGGKPVGCRRAPRVRGRSVSDAVLEDRR
ncbi:MAG: type II toxin-antitoxin system prevent-host-death family antitoxin [Deltaproteobacteria bacterium]|nr:type II toxin-antitoxin system prevent-host-death family antitoxin [Deltaproteobacteria bacterium]